MRIQVSETTYKLLEHKYLFQERGIIEVKGKGKVNNPAPIGLPIRCGLEKAELTSLSV